MYGMSNVKKNHPSLLAAAHIILEMGKKVRPVENEKNCVATFPVSSWSESLTTNHEVSGSIPGSAVGIFPEGEDTLGDHGLGRLVKLIKGTPGTTSSYITTYIIGTT